MEIELHQMRVFKNRVDVCQHIVQEMINIETGQLIYEGGKQLNDSERQLYPCVDQNGIKATIHSHMGIIYLPNDIDLKDFMNDLMYLILGMDKKYNHLTKRARLERRAGHFTRMCAKTTMNKVDFVENFAYDAENPGRVPIVLDQEWLRSIVINPETFNINNKMNTSRFYWFVFPMRVAISNIENFENPRFSPVTQFVSIVYDKYDQLLASHGEKLVTNLTFNDFKVCQNLVSFNPKTIIENKANDEANEEERASLIDEGKCPDCKKEFKSKPGLTKHINNKTCSKKKPIVETTDTEWKCPHCSRICKNMTGLRAHMRKCASAKASTQAAARAILQEVNIKKFNQMSNVEQTEYLDELENYPEYMPQWNDVLPDDANLIALCPKRGPAFELIKYFGWWELYKPQFDMGGIYILSISDPIYHEDFRNIIIDNNLSQTFRTCQNTRATDAPRSVKFMDGEICSRCYTPLYDDIYVVLPNTKHDDLENYLGYAMCPTCLHQEPSMHSRQKKNTILRVKYPRTAAQVIDMCDLPDLKKSILKHASGEKLVDYYDDNTALYLGDKYIGWTGSLPEFINYANCNHAGKPELLTAEIFPMRTVRG